MPARVFSIHTAFLSAFTLLFLVPVSGQTTAERAATPPMGWNSWDAYGMAIDELSYMQNVQAMANKLKPFGWQYAVIDEGWFLPDPFDKSENSDKVISPNGLLMPAPNRFHSAESGEGFKILADEVHSRGLLFGIHIIHGIPRVAVKRNLPILGTNYRAEDAADTSVVCKWNVDNFGLKSNAASQAYYDSMLKLYAQWGVDYLKVDCISKPYQAGEIQMIDLAIQRSGRPIVLSLSPGPTPVDQAQDVAQHAQAWRISQDFWDSWDTQVKGWPQTLKLQFANAAAWAPYIRVGHWPDADMLPLGYLGPSPGNGSPRQTLFTADEQRTLVTGWCIFRSPLIMGGNLTHLSKETLALLTNRDVLAVNQHSSGNHPLPSSGNRVVWTAKADDGGTYVALFNLGDTPLPVNVTWKELGMTSATRRIRDLWSGVSLGSRDSVGATLAPHASELYRISER